MTISKNQLKILAAYRLQKKCDSDGLFVVEGEKMCDEALSSGFVIRTICATDDWLSSRKHILPLECDCYEVDNAILERLSSQRSPNKAWMLLERANPRPQPKGIALTLALDGLQDPGNMGTILRIADWFGIRNIMCSMNTVSCYNSKVVQSSMGSIFRTTVSYCNLNSYLSEAQSSGISVYGAMLDGDNLYTSELKTPAILVIGNEGNGISAETLGMISHKLTIPNYGKTCESLNAATATAVLCSEFARRV